MTERVYTALSQDTPSHVEVPHNAYSLIWWAVGKFGAGIVIAGFMAFWLIRIDDRAAGREEKLLEAFMHQSEIQMKTADSLEAHTDSLEAHTAAIRELNRVAERAHMRK